MCFTQPVESLQIVRWKCWNEGAGYRAEGRKRHLAFGVRRSAFGGEGRI